MRPSDPNRIQQPVQALRSPVQQAAAMRPLVMRCGAFGDMVLLTALIRQLHVRFGKPVDIISSGSWTQPLLQGQPGVGEIFLLRERHMPYWLSAGQRRLVRWLRQRGCGPTWFCDPGVGFDLLIRGGIPRDYICDSRQYPWVPGEHFVDRWIRLANLTPPALEGWLAVTADRVPSTARIDIHPAAHAALDDWLVRWGLKLRPLIVIQAGSKRTMRRGSPDRRTNTKYWPVDRWAAVIHTLRRWHPDAALLLLGTPHEYALNADIAFRSGVDGIFNVADEMPVVRLLPLLERAIGMISVDTGPAHAAAALGCPTVALFGTADPLLYRPGGPHTQVAVLVGQQHSQPDIRGITVSAVLDAWQALQAETTTRFALNVPPFQRTRLMNSAAISATAPEK